MSDVSCIGGFFNTSATWEALGLQHPQGNVQYPSLSVIEIKGAGAMVGGQRDPQCIPS